MNNTVTLPMVGSKSGKKKEKKKEHKLAQNKIETDESFDLFI